MGKKKWYYKVMGEEHGPVVWEELIKQVQAGVVTLDTFVRRATDENWQAAERYSDLFAARGSRTMSRHPSADVIMAVKSYRTVRLGVSLVYWGLLLLVLSVCALLLPAATGSLSMLFIIALIVPVTFVVAMAMGLAGKVLCLAVPEETGGKQVIYVAIILDVIAALVSLTGFVVEIPEFVGLLAQLLAVTAPVLFLVFLRKLALHLKQPALAGQAANVLRVGVGMVITFVLSIIGVAVISGSLVAISITTTIRGPLALMMLVTLVLGLIGLILYGRLLTGIKRSLG